MAATTTEFEIEGMSCEHCVRAVTTALQHVPGVTAVRVEVGKATVTVDGVLSREALANAVAEEGYRVKGT